MIAAPNPSFALTRLALAITLALSQPFTQAAAPVDREFNLGDIGGGIGFTVTGKASSDAAGRSVSAAGDVNGDGIDDVLIGARGASDLTGESYVVFGSVNAGDDSTIALSDLDGSNGFAITGKSAGDQFGRAVSSAGDINGDGIDDLIIGAYRAEPAGINIAGESYVVFGRLNLGSGGTFALNDLDGSNGFSLTGSVREYSGYAVSAAGDVNGDGIDDLIIGAVAAGGYGSRYNAGASHVVFGGNNVGIDGTFALSALDGSNGFTVTGKEGSDLSGYSVSAAGDVNGDGFDDVIIGAPYADPYGINGAGESYVVFGTANVATTGTIGLETLDGTNGFSLSGKARDDKSGRSVSGAGDINGDGIDDLIIGAPFADIIGSNGADVGESYVVFGDTELGDTGNIDLRFLNGENGFALNGNRAGDNSGVSVSSAGDVNGDGFDDLIIGADEADNSGASRTGQAGVVFGGANIGGRGTFDLFFNGSNGFDLSGKSASDLAGFSVSAAGDVNNDGVDDLIVGAFGADPGGNSFAGESYVVFMPLPDSRESTQVIVGENAIQQGTTLFRNIHSDDGLDRLRFTLSNQTTVLIETANDGTALDYDTDIELFELRTVLGLERRVSIAFNDDIALFKNRYSRIIRTLPAGTFEVDTDSNGNATIPSYALSVTALEDCDVNDPELQFTLANNQFELLSLPCLPRAGITIEDLFDDDIEGDYFDPKTQTGSWVVFTWDPVNFNYVDQGPNGILEPGQGFWISQVQTNGQDATLDLPAGSFRTPSTEAADSACSSSIGCLALPLSGAPFSIDPATNEPRLTIPNLIGNPYDQAITAFDDLRVTTTVGQCSIGSNGCTPGEATLPGSGGADVMGNVAFTFNPLLGTNGDYEQVVSGSTLNPWQGFWVFELPAATGNNPVLRFPDLPAP